MGADIVHITQMSRATKQRTEQGGEAHMRAHDRILFGNKKRKKAKKTRKGDSFKPSFCLTMSDMRPSMPEASLRRNNGRITLPPGHRSANLGLATRKKGNWPFVAPDIGQSH